MREIKFRAWMKKEFSLPNAGYDTFTISELMSGKYDFSKYENWEEYIGLKDKNDKEIYEGDIVEIIYSDTPSGFIKLGGLSVTEKTNAIVIFKFGKYVLKHNHPETGEVVYGELFKVLENNKKEIIGNIYQDGHLLNKELLK